MFNTPVARFVTRPGGYGLDHLEKFDSCTPDLIMGTLMESGSHLLKSNCIYELVLNELSGILELREKGEANIGKKWGYEYFEIQHHLGNKMWLTKDELKQLDKEIEYE